jgi:2-keto-4-pentenoate hydratase/2-oxohepta-3-ene-1,7-dioic acid hydratase in catechol pathway
MRLVSFLAGATPGWGAIDAAGDGVVDLGRRLPDIGSVRALLEGGEAALARARTALRGATADHALAALRLRPPVPEPGKIFCIGVNYAHRNAEYKDGSELPKYPSIFMRTPTSFVGHGEPLVEPIESRQLDYEGEIGVYVGRSVRRAAKADALSCIAGLTCVNEGTLRDWVHHAKFNVTQGKNFESSGAVGPWLVTADEYEAAGGYGDLRVRTRVNGEPRQDDTTANLMFDFAYLISYLSTFTTLRPGDLIVTGTPIGAGIRFDPPKFLRAGDVVEVEVTGVGTLSNVVRSEHP